MSAPLALTSAPRLALTQQAPTHVAVDKDTSLMLIDALAMVYSCKINFVYKELKF